MLSTHILPEVSQICDKVVIINEGRVVLEDRRVPSSGDILALYEAELDPDGSLLAYRRARRYSRNQATDEREASR